MPGAVCSLPKQPERPDHGVKQKRSDHLSTTAHRRTTSTLIRRVHRSSPTVQSACFTFYLRQMLHGPIQAQWVEESDSWNLYGVATFGGVVHRIIGVTMSQQELDEYNAYSDYLNREIAAGRDPFAEAPVIAGGSGSALHDGTADSAPTSIVQGPMCPRGDSNTRHAV